MICAAVPVGPPPTTCPYRKVHPRGHRRGRANRVTLSPMVETLRTLLLLFRSRSRLRVEILVLRQQLIVLRRTAPKRVRLRALDRLPFVLLYRLWPDILDSVAVIQPDTIVRWHRRGFRALWRWKSRRSLGRPWHSQRHAGPDPRDQPRQSAVGSAPHSWRATQTRDRCRPIDGGEVHVEDQASAIAILADLSAQSRRGDCLHRSIRRSNDRIEDAVRLRCPASRATTAGPCRRDRASDSRMDLASDF